MRITGISSSSLRASRRLPLVRGPTAVIILPQTSCFLIMLCYYTRGSGASAGLGT